MSFLYVSSCSTDNNILHGSLCIFIIICLVSFQNFYGKNIYSSSCKFGKQAPVWLELKISKV